MSSVNDLVSDMEEELEKTTLQGIADAIENRRIQETKDMAASDEEDEQSVNKIFYHYTGRKNRQTSEAELLFQSRNYLVVRSEMYSGKKAKYDEDGSGKYHAGWVIGHDPDQESGFFIHRLQHTKKLEGLENDSGPRPEGFYEWSEEEIRERMGFSREFQGMEDLEEGETYRIQGDISIEKKEESGYSGIDYIKEKVVKERTRERFREEKNRVAEAHEEEILGGRGDVLYVRTSSLTGPGVNVSVSLSEDTQELKEEQVELGISEEQVRDFQDDKDDWKQLTAKRRKTAVKILLKRDAVKRMTELHSEKLDEDELQAEIQEELDSEWKDEEGQQNLGIGNHLLTLSQAVEDPKARRGQNKFIVLEDSKLFVIHDEHQNQEITLDKGVYEIDALTRHDRR